MHLIILMINAGSSKVCRLVVLGLADDEPLEDVVEFVVGW